MIYPEILDKIINYYKKLPGIGQKSAERLALATIEFSPEYLEEFADNLVLSKDILTKCSVCGSLSDENVCSICSSNVRNQNLICIVEDYKSLVAFERAGNYKGVYHVLNGLISPINNVMPSDIKLDVLKERVINLDNPELIIAIKSSIEGETTTLYIKKIFEDVDVVISRLSYGVSVGAELDYLDIMTLEKALQDRKKISE